MILMYESVLHDFGNTKISLISWIILKSQFSLPTQFGAQAPYTNKQYSYN